MSHTHTHRQTDTLAAADNLGHNGCKLANGKSAVTRFPIAAAVVTSTRTRTRSGEGQAALGDAHSQLYSPLRSPRTPLVLLCDVSRPCMLHFCSFRFPISQLNIEQLEVGSSYKQPPLPPSPLTDWLHVRVLRLCLSLSHAVYTYMCMRACVCGMQSSMTLPDKVRMKTTTACALPGTL